MSAPTDAPLRVPLAVRALRGVGEALLGLPAAARWIPAAAWMGLIFFLSTRSFGPGGGSSVAWGLCSNLCHPFEYGVLALLLTLVVPRRAGWPDLDRRTSLWIAGFALVYAISDELHQSFEPTRNASVIDVLSDLTGALLAVRAAALTGGARYDARALVRLVLWGIPACVLCAALANWVPQWFPDATWL